jgi:hypothetical protein
MGRLTLNVLLSFAQLPEWRFHGQFPHTETGGGELLVSPTCLPNGPARYLASRCCKNRNDSIWGLGGSDELIGGTGADGRRTGLRHRAYHKESLSSPRRSGWQARAGVPERWYEVSAASLFPVFPLVSQRYSDRERAEKCKNGREHRVVEQNSRDRSEQAADPSEN